MALVGFHYTKMMIEKKKAAAGKINVSNNIVIADVKEAKLNMGDAKQKGVEFSFKFTTKYTPDVANIDLEGAVVFLGADTKVKEILDKWEKEKKITKEVLEEVYNHLLGKCNVEALILAKEMNLPPHIPLPKVKGN
jgi:hypothetical protein